MNNQQQKIHSHSTATIHRWAEMATMLARSFEKEVDEALLMVFVEEAHRIINWAQEQEQADLKAAARTLDEFVQQAAQKENWPMLMEQLAVEFAGLFYGVGENPVNAIESVYLGEEHILYEAPYFAVVELYRQWGYEKPQSFNEPEDHIANELDFLAYMLRSAAWAREKGADEQYYERLVATCKFLDEHLNRWGFDFSNALLKATQNPFYLSMAHFTTGLLRQLSSNNLA